MAVRKVSQNRQCSVKGCTRPWYARGVCSSHYSEMRRSGALDELEVPTRAKWEYAGKENQLIEQAEKREARNV